MQGPFLRKYGVEAKIPFTLFEVDGVDFRTDAAHAAGDTKLMKDEGAEANTSNAFVDEGQGYSITLTATEMQMARGVVYIVDSATKVWLDDSIAIDTYGNASAQHAIDLDSAIHSDVSAILVDTGTTIPGTITNIQSDVSSVLTDTGTTIPGTITTLDGKADNIQSDVSAILTDTGTTIPGTITTLDGKADNIQSDVSAILTDTGTTIPGTITNLTSDVATMDAVADSILVDTGTTIPATIANVQSDVSSVLTDTGTTIPATITTLDGKADNIQSDVSGILTDTGTTIPATITSVQSDVSAILIDTSTTLDAAVSAVQSGVTDILTDTGTTLPATLTAIQSDVTSAAINAQMSDVINTDTLTLPGQEAPTATPTISKAIGYMYKRLRNKHTQTSSMTRLYADDEATVDQTWAVSDDGTTFTKGEAASG
jgi:hypothetical protein